MVISKKFTLTKQDLIVRGKAALIFIAPSLIVLLGSILEIIPQDAKYYAIAIFIGEQLIGLLKQFIQETKYKI